MKTDWKMVSSVLLLILFIGTPLTAESPHFLQPPPGISQTEFDRVYREGANLQVVYRALYHTVRPAVVKVIAETTVESPSRSVPPEVLQDPFWRRLFQAPSQQQQQRVQSFGTGFVIDTSGLIVTNKHVVGNVRSVTIQFMDGKTVAGQVQGSDGMTDVAVIKIDPPAGLQALPLGDSDQAAVGDIVVAVGNPFGLDGTFTTGVVSGVHRANLDASGMRFIQTDASINQGNSGGPLLNLRGEVIGINRMIFSRSGDSAGIGFAIPMNAVKSIIQKIASGEQTERAFLGVEIVEIPQQYNIRGALVTGVYQESGAFHAGINPRDVIVKVDNRTVASPDDLVEYISHKHVGDVVQLVVVRSGRQMQVQAELKAF